VTLTVVKIGGSLGKVGRLAPLCTSLMRAAARHDLLLVPGGGVFADAVRVLDERHHLSDDAAHWMAVLAMEQYGLALADLIPGCRCVRSLPGPGEDGAAGVSLLLPYELLRRVDPLPHDWSVTSDSIAAWVARECGATRLVLLKDRRGMNVPLRTGTPPPRGAVTVTDLARWEAVDGHLGRLLRGLDADVWAIDGERPERLDELLDLGVTEGVRLLRPPP
jgi:aspartokinase-like uncharacterized kinase